MEIVGIGERVSCFLEVRQNIQDRLRKIVAAIVAATSMGTREPRSWDIEPVRPIGVSTARRRAWPRVKLPTSAGRPRLASILTQERQH